MCDIGEEENVFATLSSTVALRNKQMRHDPHPHERVFIPPARSLQGLSYEEGRKCGRVGGRGVSHIHIHSHTPHFCITF